MSYTTEARVKESADNAPPLDPAGWVSLAAGVLIMEIVERGEIQPLPS